MDLKFKQLFKKSKLSNFQAHKYKNPKLENKMALIFATCLDGILISKALKQTIDCETIWHNFDYIRQTFFNFLACTKDGFDTG